MDKSSYLRKVSAFVDYLVGAWTTSFCHEYEIRSPRWLAARNGNTHWHCQNLQNAYENYWWLGNFIESTAELTAYRYQWLEAIKTNDNVLARKAVLSIFKWGGVDTPSNIASVNATENFIENIHGAIAVLLCGSDEMMQFSRTHYRMNSAYTKAYAIINDQLIIYDGRVGAALGLLARNFLSSSLDVQEHETLKHLLAFPWGMERTKGVSRANSSRNPSQGIHRFPHLRPDRPHAQWMIRASWIVQELIERLKNPRIESRHVEAALFMVGYKVTNQSN